MRNRMRALVGGLAWATTTLPIANGYTIDGGWPSGTISMRLMLDAGGESPALPPGGLDDGADNWTNAVRPALDTWNLHLGRSQFSSSISSTLNAARGNGINDVFFAETIYGESFGDRTLAVAASLTDGVNGVRFTESDVIFNASRSWDSYRGSLRSRTDIRRVALHEFGHVLGLNHPDEDTPPQAVAAIMNSQVSNIDTLQQDDIDAVSIIYDIGLKQPTITTDLNSLTLIEGAASEIVIGLDGVLRPEETDLMKFAWFFRPTGGELEPLFTIHDGFIKLGAAQLDDAGTYSLTIETPLGDVRSRQISVNVSPVTKDADTRLANLSTRARAGSGDEALIAGFVVEGNIPRRVLVRGIGPSLPVTGAVVDTFLELNSGSTLISSNDDWDDGGNAAELQQAFDQVGAFSLPIGSGDSAIIATLSPGSHTAKVTPNGGPEGLVLVELYDLDAGSAADSRLINLSTRGMVGQGNDIIIAGFVISGTGPRTYVLRAVGDTLATFGVAGFLDDTTLDLFDLSGNLVRRTDDWDSPGFLQPKFTSVFEQVGAFQLTDRQESALLLTLNPGVYTLHLAGFEGQTGAALVEIFEVDL